jgi:hypothetical protein
MTSSRRGRILRRSVLPFDPTPDVERMLAKVRGGAPRSASRQAAAD